MVKLETTESKWEVELDVTKFKPEDLKVSRFLHIVFIALKLEITKFKLDDLRVFTFSSIELYTGCSGR